MSEQPTRVTIVGGGVAALEAMIALRQLAEERVAIELVTPTPDWSYRPLAVAEPFGLGEATRYDLVRITSAHGATMHLAGVQAVRPREHELLTWDGRTLDYDLLLIAIGAQPTVAIPGSVMVKGRATRAVSARCSTSSSSAVSGAWPSPCRADRPGRCRSTSSR